MTLDFGERAALLLVVRATARGGGLPGRPSAHPHETKQGGVTADHREEAGRGQAGREEGEGKIMSEAWRRQEGEPATKWLARLEGAARLGLDDWGRASLGVYLDAARRQVEQERRGAETASAAREEAAEAAREEKAAAASQARRAAREDLSQRALAALARPRRAPNLGEAKAAYRRLTIEQRLQFADWLSRGAPADE